MTEFRGVAFPVHDSANRRPVELELLRVFVIMRTPDDQWLGSWPVTELMAAHAYGPRFRVSLRRENLFLDVENPQQFLDALENAVEAVENRSFRGKFGPLATRSLPNAELSGRNESDSLTAKRPPIDLRTVASTSGMRGIEKEKVVTHGVSAEVDEYKVDVVEWFGAGMTAWFEFYFELGSQQGRERLEQAAAGLEKAALQLRTVSQQLEMLETPEESSDLLAYSRSVGIWAAALEQIAVGCRMDQPAWANDGFAKMNEGTAIIEQILSPLPKSPPPKVVSAVLSYLDALVPDSKIANRSVLLAKEPWRRALLAAGWAHESRSFRVAIWSTVVNFRNRISSLFSARM